MAHPFVTESHVLHRVFRAKPEKVVDASGVKLVLESGRQVYDASAGPAVSILGQSRPDITEAIVRQMDKCAYIYSGAPFASAAVEELAAFILRDRPGGLSKAIFVSSGSEATDAAIKLATQYWHEVGRPRKRFVIARKQSYHGNTIGALCVSGHDARRSLYVDWMSSNVKFVDPCFAYRYQKSDETKEDYALRLARQLESLIVELGPENVSSFIAETVSGTTLGCVPAVKGYFKAVREICDKYDILLILDEVSLFDFATFPLPSKFTPLLVRLSQPSTHHLSPRLCAALAKRALCMHGNKKISGAQTSRRSAKPSEADSCRSQVCCSIRRSLMP